MVPEPATVVRGLAAADGGGMYGRAMAAADEMGKRGILGKERGREDATAELVVANEPGAARAEKAGLI